ncbi:MAG: hypothetical protein CO029_00290 [Candidatus Magasanikbacteria bacterium CG_4_9_14_0_2_um_filter_41_10]|uniref:HD domain-containing protein n=1 Tax=Candidatus Magasanikbacteria bacterium CG_4_10_14_0_2_um_filter_41_31 TaxID=1974639 RepID=A0A2M7V232_9BACT|nr:MAG: hypothetical protein AUJ37_00470 [Candidatus Magasanikbacteria bacterium CG1_02_41_34]PIZ92316.1 MAG: hypothetical protein COX83_04450 [Candidatus Magasanikbacteria bacterium CG_4_10_14_0_2_um_filter_41_31]PJC53907.1 MAG: hypothetical protein CO029_00290 [Candidatus Magasanikbacteria bacterium CG_4_9_14_0_2_um_filter_41_10]
MLWQDLTLTVVSIILSLAMLPQLYHGYTQKKGYMHHATSIPTVLGLYVLCFVYFSLGLVFSTVVTFFTATMWVVLLMQRVRYGDGTRCKKVNLKVHYSFSEKEQQKLDIVVNKVKELFATRPDKVHGFDHAERVAANAAFIATHQGKDVLMPTLAGWLHDIGRAIEEHPEDFPQFDHTKSHHELSYELLQEWFRTDDGFAMFIDEEKLELLYDVRNHWNDEADKYASAYILRDADKIDGLGEIGLQRHHEHTKGNLKKAHMGLRLRYEWLCHFKTDTAKRLNEERDLIAPFEAERTRLLKDNITSVEL